MTVLDLDASSLARKIAEGEISSLEATEEYIARLREINPQVNCLVEDRFTEALREAREADEALARGEWSGRLFGVPISMKESFDVRGMKTTGGIPSLKDEIKENDAEVVARLKKEGAIILGKTNTPVLCFCQETDNKLYGRTNNPWDLNMTAGGSSGGEAALIAVGGAAVGLGSDIGGSIRFPSHFNGVIGFKSGNEQVSQKGSFPYVDNDLQERMLGIGAIAKSVQDARMINEIIASIPEEKDLGSFSFVVPFESLGFPVSQDTKSSIAEVRGYLEEEFSLVDEEPPYYRDSAILWQEIMSVDGASGVAEVAFGKANPVGEHLKEKIFGSSELHHYFTWAMVGTSLFKPKQKRVQEIREIIDQGDRVIGEYLSSRILILPVYHTPAQVHGRVYSELFSLSLSYKRYMPFVAYANTWGLPVLTVPVAESEGLPVAVQVISGVGNEDAIFKAGEMLEKRFRGYRRALV